MPEEVFFVRTCTSDWPHFYQVCVCLRVWWWVGVCVRACRLPACAYPPSPSPSSSLSLSPPLPLHQPPTLPPSFSPRALSLAPSLARALSLSLSVRDSISLSRCPGLCPPPHTHPSSSFPLSACIFLCSETHEPTPMYPNWKGFVVVVVVCYYYIILNY